MSSESLSRAELLAELRRLTEELGKVPSTADMTAHGEYSIAPYYKQFESWTTAVETAGYEPNVTPVRRTQKALLDDLHRLADECGRKPTTTDIETHGIASPETYRNRFGSLNDALEAAGFERRTKGTKLSREELCDALRTLADELGRPPTTTDMRTDGPYSEGTYVNRFGSWTAACEAAGIGHPPAQKITDQQLIDALDTLASDLGHTPTTRDMDDHGQYTAGTYRERFGSWDRALKAAGLDSEQRDTPEILSKRALIIELESLKTELGQTPTTTDMNEHGQYSAQPYRDRFGSWDAALEAAGFEPAPQEPANKLSEQELLEEVNSLATELGRPPTTTDMQTHGTYSPGTYLNRFESWDAVLAAAGLERRSQDTANCISEQELIAELKSLSVDLDRTPTTTEMNERGQYSAQPYRDRFGSWDAALDAAGLEPTRQEPANKLSEQELLEEVNALAAELGHPPTTTDMRTDGAYSPGTYVNRFGSWAQALTAADTDGDSYESG